MSNVELKALTFKDVWEAEGTETSVVAHFQSLQMPELTIQSLLRSYATETIL